MCVCVCVAIEKETDWLCVSRHCRSSLPVRERERVRTWKEWLVYMRWSIVGDAIQFRAQLYKQMKFWRQALFLWSTFHSCVCVFVLHWHWHRNKKFTSSFKLLSTNFGKILFTFFLYLKTKNIFNLDLNVVYTAIIKITWNVWWNLIFSTLLTFSRNFVSQLTFRPLFDVHINLIGLNLFFILSKLHLLFLLRRNVLKIVVVIIWIIIIWQIKISELESKEVFQINKYRLY